MRYGALVLWTCWVFQPAQGRRNIRPPHFASKVSYSASPQTFAEYPRGAPCSDAAHDKRTKREKERPER